MKVGSLRRSGPPPQRKVVIPPAVKELLAARNEQAAPPQRRTKIGRNERCPCESGRKYKHCHGRWPIAASGHRRASL
ncbi:SEC-C metal-binding domain-containing protein [Bradyrhizobium sp. USDA 3256]